MQVRQILAGVLGAAVLAGSTLAADVDDYRIGEPVTHGNLTVYPILSKQPRMNDRYITLDEGLKAGLIEIVETGAAQGAAPNVGDFIPNLTPLNPGQTPQLIPNLPEDPLPSLAPNPGEAPNPPAAPQGCQLELEEEEQAQQQTDQAVQQIEQSAQQQAGPPQQEITPQQLQQLQIDNAPPLRNQIGQQAGGPAGTVNTLMVVNRSGKPLYLMPGEIVIGGKQDRTIGRELVIAPTGKPTPIDAFCVEAGRWAGRSTEKTVEYLNAAKMNNAGKSVAFSDEDLQKLAKDAQMGKFIASIGNLNKGGRIAVQLSKAQGEVWRNVQQQNAAAGVANPSNAFTDNYASAKTVAKLDPYLEAIEDAIAGRKNVVGVVVAVNGKLETLDMFESTPLFKKLWPKLLKSYALDAASQQPEKPVASKLTEQDAQVFMANAFSAKVADTDKKADNLHVTTRRADKIISFSAADEAAPSESVHFSAFSE